MLSATQLATQLSMQNGMNTKVHPQWFEQGFEFLRAVVVEGTEAIEHHGWKWWKKQTMDLPQLQMELVDIWHFMLSQYLVDAQGDQNKALSLIQTQTQKTTLTFDGKDIDITSLNCLAKLELLIGLAAAKRMDINLFAALLVDCQMDWQELYKQYVGKNTLNFFRQDFGYKEGTYHKEWQGREDNEHLAEILDTLDLNSKDVQTDIYQALKLRYPN